MGKKILNKLYCHSLLCSGTQLCHQEKTVLVTCLTSQEWDPMAWDKLLNVMMYFVMWNAWEVNNLKSERNEITMIYNGRNFWYLYLSTAAILKLHYSLCQVRFSSPATMTVSLMRRLYSTVRNSIPPSPPLGSYTPPGIRDSTSAGQAGWWTAVSATPSRLPSLNAEAVRSASTSSMPSPTRRDSLMSTHATMPTVLEVGMGWM